IASGVWSAFAFSRLSGAFDRTLAESDRTTAATAAVTNALEREDDALLFSLTGDARAADDVRRARSDVAAWLAKLDAQLATADERAILTELHGEISTYEAAGDRLREVPSEARPRLYYGDVNPLLRRAVDTTDRVRDEHFRTTHVAAAWARDEARRATGIVSAISLVALALSVLVALRLARVVIGPLSALTRSVEAIRQGDFGRRVAPARDDELGRLAEGFNRMAEDIEEFRRSNIGEVVRINETLEAVLAALPDAVLLIDAEGRVSSANDAASRILAGVGRSGAEHISEIALPDAAKRATLAAVAGAAPEPGSIDLARTFALQLGEEKRHLLPRAMPIVASSTGRRGAVLVLYDVTDLARVDAMRVELVGVASHELRTPLTTLRMTLLMLEESARELGERQRALLATALVGIEQLAATVDEYLDLTRAEAGELRLVLERVDVAELARRAVADVAGRCEEAGIAVSCVVDGTSATLRADAARLAAVLRNLLENAVKYTPQGGTIEVRVSPQNAGSGAPSILQIAVTDDGLGVPPEYRQRVFEKFFRVEHHRSVDRTAKGAGIGLYLARQIVEAHGGRIDCEPGIGGRGTSIVLSLPVAPAAPDSVRP
ncbi:MAG TPA: ATP-binding protein, partial [Minicystis sp.]|nr:ATP-binding protein [Minicystis sp.]